MNVDKALAIYEPRIEAIARGFYTSHSIIDRDDLAQAGRIALWKLALEQPEVLVNESYVNATIRNAMKDALPKKELHTDSIYRNLFDEGSLTLEETIPSSTYSPEIIIAGEAEPVVFDFGGAYKRRFERETAEVYSNLLIGRRKKAPNGFWKGKAGIRRARFCFRKFLAGINMTPAEFIRGGDAKLKLIRSYNLGGAFDVCYGTSIPELVADIFPMMMPWEYRHRGMYKSHDKRIAAIKAAFEGIAEEDISKHATKAFFKQNKLEGLLSNYYGGSTHLAVEAAYPGQFRPWEFNRVPNGYWSGEKGLEHAGEAVRWLLDRTEVALPELKTEMVMDRFSGMFGTCFGNSITRLRKYVSSTKSLAENQSEKVE